MWHVATLLPRLQLLFRSGTGESEDIPPHKRINMQLATHGTCCFHHSDESWSHPDHPSRLDGWEQEPGLVQRLVLNPSTTERSTLTQPGRTGGVKEGAEEWEAA